MLNKKKMDLLFLKNETYKTNGFFPPFLLKIFTNIAFKSLKKKMFLELRPNIMSKQFLHIFNCKIDYFGAFSKTNLTKKRVFAIFLFKKNKKKK